MDNIEFILDMYVMFKIYMSHSFTDQLRRERERERERENIYSQNPAFAFLPAWFASLLGFFHGTFPRNFHVIPCVCFEQHETEWKRQLEWNGL